MQIARDIQHSDTNSFSATQISYDLQSGTYTHLLSKNPIVYHKWGSQLASFINDVHSPDYSILEVGVGEATTLSTVLQGLKHIPSCSFGTDFSWSRCAYAKSNLALLSPHAPSRIFVSDFSRLPLADSSVDIVYSSHSLEPNSCPLESTILELARVSRKYVFLFEPIYELADLESRKRMESHKYVTGIHDCCTKLGLDIIHYDLLPFSINPLNPSGVVCFRAPSESDQSLKTDFEYRCTVSKESLIRIPSGYYSSSHGLFYPELLDIPVFLQDSSILSTKLLHFYSK